MNNKYRMEKIIESALQIARLNAHGCIKETDQLLLLCKSDIGSHLSFYREKLETDAMGLLMNQDIKYEGE